MHELVSSSVVCPVTVPLPPHRRERGVRAVVLLTAVMMVVEILVGYATGSMALLADGWHMATHVGALGLASVAYAVARHYASHRAFAFGTGKVHALAGFTSAVALGLVAAVMIVESIARLFSPGSIDFVRSLPVAVVGLGVNLISMYMLHDRDAEHEGCAGHHDHGHHDHNHRAALMHVVADALTSALAIAALIAGRVLGWVWLDAVTGVVGGLVILKWSGLLCRNAAFELLDVDTSEALQSGIRQTLEAVDDVAVSDLHVWSLGQGARGCVVTVVSASPREAKDYRARLAAFRLAHLTIEVQRCADGHGATKGTHLLTG